MFRSIRWSLLFWYGLILVVILAGFGATVYHNLARSMRERTDAQLMHSSRAVFSAFGPPRRSHPENRIRDEVARHFRRTDADAPYCVIWDGGGRVIAQSNPSLAIAPPFVLHPPDPPRGGDEAGERGKSDEWRRRPRPEGGGRPPARDHGPADGFGGLPLYRNRDANRECIVRGPRGFTILVGQPTEDEARRLREFLGMVLAVGIGTLGLALLGGWFLAGRALAPIARISEAASSISALNLSRRIDVRKTESELGRLATILNVTFDRLEAAFVRQMQFTADASHELRTPLSVVMSHAELALRKDRSAADYRTTLETCLKAAHRMESVVEGLLTLARADARELGLKRERIDLSLVVDESLGLLESLSAPRRITIRAETIPLDVDGDEARLREAITNLITNAIHYNQEGGTVSIVLHQEGPLAVLSVADTGIGIADEDQPQIFERFFRANSARSREVGGNGLGLAISKWIVEAHGGSIGFRSQEGQGTTFTLTLPVAAGNEGPHAKDSTRFEALAP